MFTNLKYHLGFSQRLATVVDSSACSARLNISAPLRLCAMISVMCLAITLFAEQPRRIFAETPAQKAERLSWWTEGRFGMFIHFGLYSPSAHAAGMPPGESIRHCRRRGDVEAHKRRQGHGSLPPLHERPDRRAFDDLRLHRGEIRRAARNGSYVQSGDAPALHPSARLSRRTPRLSVRRRRRLRAVSSSTMLPKSRWSVTVRLRSRRRNSTRAAMRVSPTSSSQPSSRPSSSP